MTNFPADTRNAIKTLIAGELSEGALEAARLLREIVKDKDVDKKLRVQAARALKDAAGYGAYSAKTLEAKATKPLSETPSNELRRNLEAAEAELAKRATPVQQLDHAPTQAHNSVQDTDIF